MINALQVLYPKLPCDPFRDFLPVTQLVNARIRQLGEIPVA